MPLFSVVIPSFNRVTLLDATLKSVFAQHFTDYEIIVVDDGSTDATMDYLQSLQHRVAILHQPNQGPGAARNRGARHAGGSYLAFLDSDDLWFPWTLEVYRDVIRKYNDPSFVTGRPYLFSDGDEWKTLNQSAMAESEGFVDSLASGGWRWWSASSFVIRRDAFTAAGGFTDEWGNGEDVDLTLRLGVAHGFVHITAPVTFAYRNHAASLKHDVTRTYATARLMVRAEHKGNYPGGGARARERRQILTRHTRAVTLLCLRQGLLGEAWMLYRATFTWNASLRRLKYLAGFPLLVVAAWTRCLLRVAGIVAR
jgi:glycosyltransferase involved in cell wall biosynthesis